ncbi:hypothetical protein ACCO45_003127 [Purpureocillium lilacinum]|uniref:Uncharacterized protein n=1 Tax=Purpureocillium lilacinum TaxID=33203 RepID=A0ACC4E1G1_PURLI
MPVSNTHTSIAMKNVLGLALAASLAASATANSHHHLHRHARKHVGTKVVDKRIEQVEVVVVAAATAYEMAGKPYEASKAEQCIERGDSGNGGTGLTAEFPSGTIKCSHFPSDYGAVGLDWLKTGLWSGLQHCPGHNPIEDTAISFIETLVAGDTCKPETYCSYACPPGWEKSQWPKTQGATGQSVGGLWCNKSGFLELSRPSVKTLCQKGAGGITIKNDLSEVVSTCRTDYSGTENMVIPFVAQPGSTVEVTNPMQSETYVWQGKKTSAQYYINPMGLDKEEACIWGSATRPNVGNWAPLVLGVSQDESGVTWIGLQPNWPTSSAVLPYTVTVTVNGSKQCSVTRGNFSNGNPKGCTVSAQKGDSVVVRFS